MTIGAQAEADIAFPGLEFEHAELTHEQGEWVIRRRNPDARVEFRGHGIELKKLNPGDQLFLGSGTLTFLGMGDQEITAVTQLANLTYPFEHFEFSVLNGPERGRVITIEPGEYILGRAEQKHIYTSNNRRIEFDHMYVSRTHARLYVDNYRIRVQDMMSTNGTRINRQLIKSGELKPGDVLSLGKLKLRLSGPENPSASVIPTVRVKLKDTTWRKWALWLGLIYAVVIFLAFYAAMRFFF
ncbi:MAG TPA: FHA domain-containing protein [bacterium]|nr:FHA domain-containing protein [bacterium]